MEKFATSKLGLVIVTILLFTPGISVLLAGSNYCASHQVPCCPNNAYCVFEYFGPCGKGISNSSSNSVCSSHCYSSELVRCYKFQIDNCYGQTGNTVPSTCVEASLCCANDSLIQTGVHILYGGIALIILYFYYYYTNVKKINTSRVYVDNGAVTTVTEAGNGTRASITATFDDTNERQDVVYEMIPLTPPPPSVVSSNYLQSLSHSNTIILENGTLVNLNSIQIHRGSGMNTNHHNISPSASHSLMQYSLNHPVHSQHAHSIDNVLVNNYVSISNQSSAQHRTEHQNYSIMSAGHSEVPVASLLVTPEASISLSVVPRSRIRTQSNSQLYSPQLSHNSYNQPQINFVINNLQNSNSAQQPPNMITAAVELAGAHYVTTDSVTNNKIQSEGILPEATSVSNAHTVITRVNGMELQDIV